MFIGCLFLDLYSEIKVVQADMLDLPFDSECFDVVIEKGTMVKAELNFLHYIPLFCLGLKFCECGFQVYTFLKYDERKLMICSFFSSFLVINLVKDVLFVDAGDPWNPREETVNKVMATLDGVHRVLKPDGIFISITFGQVIRGTCLI